MIPCAVPHCTRAVYARDLCKSHYETKRRGGKPRRPGVRVPVEPLMDMYSPEVDSGHIRHGVAHVERILGLGKSQLHQWRRKGGIILDTADKIAVRAGMHPAEIWGRAWWDACEREMELSADYDAIHEPFEDDPCWPWKDSYTVPAHVCAADGCACGGAVA